MFTFVVWKWKAGCLGLDSYFLNLWPKLSDYVVTSRIVVVLTRFPYLTLGTELGWFVNNQWTLGLKLSVRIFANKLYSQLIFNQSGRLPLASQPARWERTRCRLCSLRSLPPPPSLSPWRRGTQCTMGWGQLKGIYRNFGTLFLILFTSKYFRWKFQPCPSL